MAASNSRGMESRTGRTKQRTYRPTPQRPVSCFLDTPTFYQSAVALLHDDIKSLAFEASASAEKQGHLGTGTNLL